MNIAQAQSLITTNEGCKLKPYYCPAGKLTIGVGRNLDDRGITSQEALYLLENDIRDCVQDLLKIFPNQFYSFPENIQLVLIDMRFNLGPGGFRTFKKMIKAFKTLQYSAAIIEMKDSRWYGQVTNRADRLINMIRKEMNYGTKKS